MSDDPQGHEGPGADVPRSEGGRSDDLPRRDEARTEAGRSDAARTDAGRSDAAPIDGGRAASRDADIRLASLHLRTGLLSLARAELEIANEDEVLRADELADLAEARWRTGDLEAAGQAAAAALAGGSDAPVARVIAAEAALRSGTAPEDVFMDVGSTIPPAELDRTFAGLPRSPAWPADGLVYPAPGEALEDGQPRAGRHETQRSRPSARTPVGPGLASGLGTRSRGPAAAAGLPDDPSAELDAAADDLAAGDDAAAAVRLAVLLRAAPASAPAVAELLEDAGSPILGVVKGDALRLLGRAAEAERAWAESAAAIDGRRAASMRRTQPAERTEPERAEAAPSPTSPGPEDEGDKPTPPTGTGGTFDARSTQQPNQEEPS